MTHRMASRNDTPVSRTASQTYETNFNKPPFQVSSSSSSSLDSILQPNTAPDKACTFPPPIELKHISSMQSESPCIASDIKETKPSNTEQPHHERSNLTSLQPNYTKAESILADSTDTTTITSQSSDEPKSTPAILGLPATEMVSTGIVSASGSSLPLQLTKSSCNVLSTSSPITMSLHPSGVPHPFQKPSSLLCSSQCKVMYEMPSNVTSSNSLANNTIPEFLYQLTKMLSDDNRDVIEWSNGKIEVHSPTRLESEVLKKYFRHSKFASFQRQLNYFGFRKLAGKGKMAPCSYVNDAAGIEVMSLLQVKRKSSLPVLPDTNNKKSKPGSTVGMLKSSTELNPSGPPVNPILANIFNRSMKQISVGTAFVPANTSITSGIRLLPDTSSNVATDGYHALAQRAAGRGIRHKFNPPMLPQPMIPQPKLPQPKISPYNPDSGKLPPNIASAQTSYNDQTQSRFQPSPETSQYLSQHSASACVNSSAFDDKEVSNDCLSQLESNFRNSLNQSNETLNMLSSEDADPTPLCQMRAQDYSDGPNSSNTYSGFLPQNSSLVDLAMLAPIGDTTDSMKGGESDELNFDFIDFPNSDFFQDTDMSTPEYLNQPEQQADAV